MNVIVVAGGNPNTNNNPNSSINSSDGKVIVVTGGTQNSFLNSAEALNIDGTRLCNLPDLPTPRRHHSMSGRMICGGKSCIKFDQGNWKEFPWKLQEERGQHSSWKRSDGKTRLLGGYNSRTTSEIISETGSEMGFPMKYKTSRACSIQFEDQVILTGGLETRNIVSVYNDDGWVRDLAPLKTGRYWHACGHYTSDNDLKYIVAGGYRIRAIASTEIYSTSRSDWNDGVPLPSPRYFFSNGISVDNNVFLLGGKVQKRFLSDVLKLDKENGQWVKVGEMRMPRAAQASSVMPLKDIQPYCVPDQ